MSLTSAHEELTANFSGRGIILDMNRIQNERKSINDVEHYLTLINNTSGIPDKIKIVVSLMNFLIKDPYLIINYADFAAVVLFKLCELITIYI